MTIDDVAIAAVSRDDGWIMLESGEVCPFTNMFDAFGNETTNRDECVCAVAELPDGSWLTLYLPELETATVH